MWEWIYTRWSQIAYRTKHVVMSVAMAEDRKWWPIGEGKQLSFERIIDPDSGQWPYDREVIDLSFDSLGRLKSVDRKKIIYVEHGRSHADLIRMLGEPATDKPYPAASVR